MKFSTTHGPSVSQSTLQRTRLGSVGSFSLVLYHMSPDVPNWPFSLHAQAPLNTSLWASGFYKLMKGTTTDPSIFLLNVNGLQRGEGNTSVHKVTFF